MIYRGDLKTAPHLPLPAVSTCWDYSDLHRIIKLMISENKVFSLDSSVSALLQIRKALGLSRKQFGQLIGMNEDTIGKWERGLATPTLTIPQIKIFDKCLQDLGMTWEELPDHIGDPNNKPQGFKRTRKGIK